ncbi:MAG: GntR family transcriptional regulator [Lachnospiraceae bacterium]
MAVLKKQSLSDQLYEQIRVNIINLTFPLGSKLNVNELQEIYEVSSTPIREAINRLQVEGLVTYENNIGARVLSLHEKDISEIQDLALVLHSAAVRFSMARGHHQEMVKEMKDYLQDYYAAKTDKEEVKSVFHIMGVFYKYCGNERLDNNMKVIQGEQLLLRYLYRTQAQGDKSGNNYLEQMVKAVENDDADRVIKVLEKEYCDVTPVLVRAVKELEAVQS